MTRTNRGFPIAVRTTALLVVLFLCAALGVGVSAASPRSDKQEARDAFEAAKDRLAEIQDEIDRIEADLAVKAQQVDAAEAELDATITELFRVREHLAETQANYDRIVEQLNARAVEAFMSGPTTSMDFLLGATSITDLSDRFEYVDAVARSDADLAQEVQSTKNVLLAQRADLEALKARRREALERAKEIRDDVIRDLARANELESERKQVFEEADKDLKEALRAWKQAQLAAQAVAGGGPLPAEYRDYFHNCPVGHPRSYWDGFGAPRYAGGYHLHKGVDMLAPTGTPIFSPFAGTAHTDSNTLGGKVVFVDGPHGRVYNAHLSAYHANSNGPVQAGDIIGYVGDTGDAIGTPHLHFEFHPHVIPSNWEASSYGYSVIEDAINPYPLLLYACG